MPYQVSVAIEKDAHGYYAYAPELPGCQSQGDSLGEVKANIQEAVELYLETFSADIVRNPRVELQRQELAQESQEALADFRAGQLRPQSAADAIAELRSFLASETKLA